MSMNGSLTSKPLKPGDPGFVNPYASFVAEIDPSGTMDDGRFYVGRDSHYVDHSPPRTTRGSNNKSQSFRLPQRQTYQPTPNTRPVPPSPTPSRTSAPGRNPTPQTNGKSSRYSTAQRVSQQSRWSGQPLVSSSKLPEGFFSTAKGTTDTPPITTTTSPTTTVSTPASTRRDNRGNGRESQAGESWGESRSADGWAESHQRAQASCRPRQEPITTIESAAVFFGTPKDFHPSAPTPASPTSSWVGMTDELPKQWGTPQPQVNRPEANRNGHRPVDQEKDSSQTSGWFTNPGFDRKIRLPQQPQPQSRPPQPQPQLQPQSSVGVRSYERGGVKEQDRPPVQQLRLPESPRRSEETARPRDTLSVPPRPSSQDGDPLVIQYPVGDGCWVKMVVYVEHDSKSANSRLPGLGRRQISGVKTKTPEQLGAMVKDAIVEEKKNLLG
ncbi:hypothetical protein BGZ59_009615 [Podila verticillata]|nr:hypothetical protein BGZ59_009615 [Podila verticillata]